MVEARVLARLEADGRVEVADAVGAIVAQTSCQAPRFNRLVVTRTDRASAARSWRLLAADPGCSYQAAAFDARGIVAVEACKHGAPRGSGSDPQLGQAYLLQLDPRDRIVARRALELGWEQGALSSERDGKVLVSQDQRANAGYPERDWVWELDGQHLRLIASYRANDAAQVIAMPW